MALGPPWESSEPSGLAVISLIRRAGAHEQSRRPARAIAKVVPELGLGFFALSGGPANRSWSPPGVPAGRDQMMLPAGHMGQVRGRRGMDVF
jgi:hypothetical protein